MPVAAVILAGGRSSRMGAPKALLDFRGLPFAVRILQVLEALDIKARVVVVGPDGVRIRPALADHDCVIVENDDVDGGPIASLRVALEALDPFHPSAALVWPVDLPHVRLATVERLLDEHRLLPAAPLAVIPTFGERRGHPVVWRAAAFPELLDSAAATTAGARSVLHQHPDRVVHVPVDDPAVIDQVNTPEDYERLVREWNRDIY